MSDNPEPNEPNEPEAQQGDPADEPLGEGGKKALTAERQRANDLEKQLNAATARLTEIERANETELEKAQREAQEARSQIEQLPSLVAGQLREHLVALHGISTDDRDLFLTSDDPEVLLKQVARLTERTATPTGPRPDPSQGGSSEPPALNSNALEEALKAKLGIT